MKIANVSWGWTPIPEDTPHGDSLIKIADQIPVSYTHLRAHET